MSHYFNLKQLVNSVMKVKPYLTEFDEFKKNDTLMYFELNELHLKFEYEGHPSYDGDFNFILEDKRDEFNSLMYSKYKFIQKFKSFISSYNKNMLEEDYFRKENFYSKKLNEHDRFLIQSFFVYFLTEIAINKLITNTLCLSYELKDKEVDAFLLDLLTDENPFLESLTLEYNDLIEFKNNKQTEKTVIH